MVEGMQRLEAEATEMGGADAARQAPTLDTICAVVLYDYQQLRYGDQPWLPATPALKALAEAVRARPSFAQTLPRIS
jgi:glutathione S-transferase